jgi:hypothetical protein
LPLIGRRLRGSQRIALGSGVNRGRFGLLALVNRAADEAASRVSSQEDRAAEVQALHHAAAVLLAFALE